jgi:hypothetical protein
MEQETTQEERNMKKIDTRTTDMGTVIGCIEVVKIVRDYEPIVAVKDGNCKSIGAFVDEHIAGLVSEGVEVQDVALHFEREQWDEIRSYYGRNEA